MLSFPEHQVKSLTSAENKTKWDKNTSKCYINSLMNLLVHWAAVNQQNIRNLLVPGTMARQLSIAAFTMVIYQSFNVRALHASPFHIYINSKFCHLL